MRCKKERPTTPFGASRAALVLWQFQIGWLLHGNRAGLGRFLQRKAQDEHAVFEFRGERGVIDGRIELEPERIAGLSQLAVERLPAFPGDGLALCLDGEDVLVEVYTEAVLAGSRKLDTH